MIDQNQSLFGDKEEEPLFWFALADTQWNYGRLLPSVKEKALLFLSKEGELQRWKEHGERQWTEWKGTHNKLKRKLEVQQPPLKKVTKFKLCQCKWHLGDVLLISFLVVIVLIRAFMEGIFPLEKYQKLHGGLDMLSQ